MSYLDTFATFEEFARAVKKWRGQGWIFYAGEVAGRQVRLKTYNHTYMQIYRVDDVNQRLSPMDCKVRDFEDALTAPFRQH